MARKFLTSLDLAQNQLLNPVIQNLAAPPSSPNAGQVYYDTTRNQFGVYCGATAGWVYVTGNVGTVTSVTAADATITIGGTASAPTVKVTAGGLDHTYISDFQTTVNATPLSSLAPPAAAVPFNGQNITGLANPVNAQDAATKLYVDSNSQGLSVKDSVVAATTSALPANTYSNGTNGVGATLTATASAALTVDGVTVSAGQRLLVQNEATEANNGIYVVTNAGSSTQPYVLTRSDDFDTSAEVPGAFTFVESGTVNANAGFVVSSGAGPYTIGTTAITFTQFSGAGQITAGTGITLTGGVIALAVPVAVSSGGTGGTTVAEAKANLGFPSKYAQTFGDGSSTSYTITHNLATQDVVVSVYDTSTFAEVDCDVTFASTNTVTLAFGSAPSTNAYRVVVIG